MKTALRLGMLLMIAAFAGCSDQQMGYDAPLEPRTIHEDTIYESPYTELRKETDNTGRVIRYEKRTK